MPFYWTDTYSLTIVRQEGPDHHFVVYIKGAPENIWDFCERIVYQGKPKNINSEENKTI